MGPVLTTSTLSTFISVYYDTKDDLVNITELDE
jgi:hypothetical protein